MAALSDVEDALVLLIAEFLSIGASYIPGSTVMSKVARVPCRAYRGWPKSAILNADLRGGTSTVSVFPVAGSTRRTTRYFADWRALPPPTPTMTVDVSGNVVAFTGDGNSIGQVAAVRLGAVRVGKVYAYRMSQADTADSVAAALGSAIPGSTVAGSLLTVPSTLGLSAAVVCDAKSVLETRRQAQNIWVTIWSPTPEDRDAVANAVDDGFANMTNQFGNLTYEFGLPDGLNAAIRYISSHTDDAPQQDNLWRRDLRFSVDYPTTIVQTMPVVVSIGGSVSISPGDSVVEFGYQPDDGASLDLSNPLNSGLIPIV